MHQCLIQVNDNTDFAGILRLDFWQEVFDSSLERGGSMVRAGRIKRKGVREMENEGCNFHQLALRVEEVREAPQSSSTSALNP